MTLSDMLSPLVQYVVGICVTLLAPKLTAAVFTAVNAKLKAIHQDALRHVVETGVRAALQLGLAKGEPAKAYVQALVAKVAPKADAHMVDALIEAAVLAMKQEVAYLDADAKAVPSPLV